MQQSGGDQPLPSSARDDAALRFQRGEGAPPLRVEIDGTVSAQPVELRVLRNGLLRCAGGPDADQLDLTGWRLAIRPPGEAGSPECTLRPRPPTFRPYLVIDGRSEHFSLPIEEGAAFEIGRGHRADLQLGDPRISRTHARIMVRGGMHHIEDLGSLLGTRLNGQPLRGLRALRRNDVLTIGSDRIVFHSLVDELREASERIVSRHESHGRGDKSVGEQSRGRARRLADSAIAGIAIAGSLCCIGWLTSIVVSA